MIKLTAVLFLIAGIGIAGKAPDPSFLETHKKLVTKELLTWSADYKSIEPWKAQGSREFYHILGSSGDTLGILILSDAPGRFDRFDLMVIADTLGTVKLIRILKYRSEFGSEITNKKWLQQFYTQGTGPFILRKNVDAVSGATYSSQGLVDEINAIRALIRKK
jgi:Na+-translocating ferredoxin:NAD+ oxidoreductase RnfG subunit